MTGRYHLEPLSSEETFKYIDHRLRVAGALTEIFSTSAKREVFRLSAGVPRIINVICDRALLGAYSRETRIIDRRIVRKAASEVSGQTVRSRVFRWLLPAAVLGAIAVAGALLWPTISSNELERTTATGEPTVLGGDRPAPPQSSRVATTQGSAPQASPAVDIGGLIDRSDDSSSYQLIFELWGLAYDAAAGTACGQAETAGLRCYFQRGTWSTLRQLDRPVVLTLTGNDGTNRQLALVGLDADVAELATPEGNVTVQVKDLEEYWFGAYLLFWKPAGGSDEQIGPGMQSDKVRWLRQSLATIDADYQPNEQNSDVFDPELEERLIAFQREHRLEADGLAGQKTQIIINTLLASDDRPRLSGSH